MKGILTAKPSIPQLTGLRFCAAIAVVFFHAWSYFIPNVPPPNLVATGYIGVTMFFVLSGYILAYIYLDDSIDKLDTRKFWIARFARVYPLYAASLLFEFPLFLRSLFGENPALTATYKLAVISGAYLSMLQAWAPRLLRWNSPTWSLSAEACFYLMFPFCAPALWRFGKRHFCVASLLVYFAALAVPIIGIETHPQHFLIIDTSRYENYLKISPLLHLPTFLAGILLASWQTETRKRWSTEASQRRAAALMWIGFIGLGTVVILQSKIPYLLPYLLLNNGLLIPMFASVIYGLANGKGWLERALSTKLMVLLGEGSYAIYLLHMPLIRWFAFLAPEKCSPGYMMLYLLLLIVLSMMSYKLLEMPLRKWIQTKLQKTSQASHRIAVGTAS